MADYDLVVLNALVVTDEDTRELDIAIKDGKIAKLVPKGTLRKGMKTIDAQGGMVMVCQTRTLKSSVSHQIPHFSTHISPHISHLTSPAHHAPTDLEHSPVGSMHMFI